MRRPIMPSHVWVQASNYCSHCNKWIYSAAIFFCSWYFSVCTQKIIWFLKLDKTQTLLFKQHCNRSAPGSAMLFLDRLCWMCNDCVVDYIYFSPTSHPYCLMGVKLESFRCWSLHCVQKSTGTVFLQQRYTPQFSTMSSFTYKMYKTVFYCNIAIILKDLKVTCSPLQDDITHHVIQKWSELSWTSHWLTFGCWVLYRIVL